MTFSFKLLPLLKKAPLWLGLLFLVGCPSKSYKKTKSYKKYGATGKRSMISTQGPLSTKAGQLIFKKGGNAVDAAIAVSFAISVERPQSTGLGGGGFLLLKTPDSETPLSFDFREMAPNKSHQKMFLGPSGEEQKGRSINGPLSAGVPGLVAGLFHIHKKFGSLPMETLIEPAAKMAEEGFPVYPHLAKAIKARAPVLKNYPSSKKIFFKNGEPLKVGDRLIQEDLAKTLRLISHFGKKGFYGGFVGNQIAKENQKEGGIISLEDLANYKVKEREPVKGSYKGYDIYSMGPPSSGGIHILQILNIIEKDPLKKMGYGSADSIHLISSAMQMAFVDRAFHLGDSDFVKVPTQKLISKNYAKMLRSKIKANSAQTFEESKMRDPFTKESDETTHLTIMDKSGWTVSSTQTINGWMGSGFVVPGTGVILNNEMDDFAQKVGASNLFEAFGGEKNLIEPKKRPLSSMSPTIILKDGKVKLALGTPSGTRILTCVAQTIINYLTFEMDLYEAVAATRFHHQWSPNEIRVGSNPFPTSVISELEKKGHKVKFKPLGCKIQAIADEGAVLRGVSDPRGEGLSLGE